ncbi:MULTISPECIES: haloacid dehalogenase type II [unclassified Modestobacter]|uniref:haloacid dehalogenase type II n=1 Tax=unclassified Modestobacter TaxID=2643866 RepID=UPI0022AA0BF2|nr:MULTISPECIES: haloacid dehalogenase type II [unclassified Modestobacter]MCZ2824435.1 haloacid dehalogenase type II [Modestobacter sp. VKM Ac-2981]MCZ2854037.1 haloacid dehalogenase type II [Modestobacter sp. VKM Ac-2982]
MSTSPSVIVFDVNETLSDMSPMAQRFSDVGAPAHLAKLWFASLLRDGFALTAAGASRPFAELGTGALRTVLQEVELDRDLDDAVDHVMAGFGQLPVHPDVPDGVRTLRESGRRLVTLTNGSTQVSDRLLTDAGIRDQFEALLSVEDAGIWKPARGAYEYAARTCDSDPGDMLLVAVHPWDIDGAARAGLRTAWLDRAGTPYPDSFTPPSLRATGLTDLAGQLG